MARSDRVGKHATTVAHVDNVLVCVYHRTVVAKLYDDGHIQLNSGGWRTVTTKCRMNQFAAQYCNYAFSVCQRKGDWFVVNCGDNEVPFTDGMVFTIRR